MAFQTLLPIANRGPASLQAGPVNDPGTIAAIAFRLPHQNWTDPTRRITVTLEETRNGGATWLLVYRNTWAGGALDRNGAPLVPAFRVSFGPEEIFQRQLRAVIDYTGVVRHGVEYEVVFR